MEHLFPYPFGHFYPCFFLVFHQSCLCAFWKIPYFCMSTGKVFLCLLVSIVLMYICLELFRIFLIILRQLADNAKICNHNINTKFKLSTQHKMRFWYRTSNYCIEAFFLVLCQTIQTSFLEKLRTKSSAYVCFTFITIVKDSPNTGFYVEVLLDNTATFLTVWLIPVNIRFMMLYEMN